MRQPVRCAVGDVRQPSMRSAPEGGCDLSGSDDGSLDRLPSMRSAPEGGCDGRKDYGGDVEGPSMRSAPEGGCDDATPARPCRHDLLPSMRSAPEGGCDPMAAGVMWSKYHLQCGPPRRADATMRELFAQHGLTPSMRSAPEGGCDVAVTGNTGTATLLQCGPPRRADATRFVRHHAL